MLRNIKMSVPSSFLCRKDPVILGLSGKFLGTHTECEPGYWTLLAKLAFSVGSKRVHASSCLIIHPINVFLLMTSIGLVTGDGQGGLACCSPWGRKVKHD